MRLEFCNTCMRYHDHGCCTNSAPDVILIGGSIIQPCNHLRDCPDCSATINSLRTQLADAQTQLKDAIFDRDARLSVKLNLEKQLAEAKEKCAGQQKLIELITTGRADDYDIHKEQRDQLQQSLLDLTASNERLMGQLKIQLSQRENAGLPETSHDRAAKFELNNSPPSTTIATVKKMAIALNLLAGQKHEGSCEYSDKVDEGCYLCAMAEKAYWPQIEEALSAAKKENLI